MQLPINFQPSKKLGQNFLTNSRIVEKIVQAAELNGTEIVLEIGPGLGILTEALVQKAAQVIAIEKDARLYEFLKAKFAAEISGPADKKKLTLIHGDALEQGPPDEPYALIANIPYSITSPLLDHFIRDNPGKLPTHAVVMVQKEVAQKICAQPPHMNVLSLHIQTFGSAKMVSVVSKENFKPVPRVDSAVVQINFDRKTAYPKDFLKKYFEIIHAAFTHKRKMLRSTFDEILLRKAGIDPERRPETLSIDEWKTLTKNS